jgi:hypothetical protein
MLGLNSLFLGGLGERLGPVCPARGNVYSVHRLSAAAVHPASRLPSCHFCRHHFIQLCVPNDMICRQYLESPGASWRTHRSPSRKIHRPPYGGVIPTESRGCGTRTVLRVRLGFSRHTCSSPCIGLRHDWTSGLVGGLLDRRYSSAPARDA